MHDAGGQSKLALLRADMSASSTAWLATSTSVNYAEGSHSVSMRSR